MPQPIDMTSEIARVTTADRLQQIADRLSLAAQMRAATETQEERVAVETQVQQTQAQSEQVEAELRRRNPYARRRVKRAYQTDEEEKPITGYDAHEHLENLSESEGRHLDVLVSDDGVIE